MSEIPEAVLRARKMYGEGAATRDIIKHTGLSIDRLYHWLDGGPKRDGRRPLPAVPRRRIVTRRRILKSERIALVTRMMRAAEQQVRDIEERLAAVQPEPAARDRDARLLAVLVKTMRELTALDAQQDNETPRAESAAEDELPPDIDDLRRELARRVDRIRSERDSAAGAGGDRS
jgi:hypothetical protein